MRESFPSPDSGEACDPAPSPVDIHVGHRLRERRRSLDITQRALGERVGVTFQQIQKYERGTNRISASRLYDMAKILGVPPAYFFEGLPLVDEGVLENDPMIHPLTLDLISAFTRISSPKIRAAAFALLKSLAGGKRSEGPEP